MNINITQHYSQAYEASDDFNSFGDLPLLPPMTKEDV